MGVQVKNNPNNIKNQSLIIIDDNETDRYLLKRLLKKGNINCEVFEAENGKIALDFFTNEEENKKKHPDSYPPLLIFLDINMPIMGGFEFLEAFNELKAKRDILKSVVFAMITSSDRKEDIEKAKSYDFVEGFITKGSLTVEILKETILKKFPDIIFEE